MIKSVRFFSIVVLIFFYKFIIAQDYSVNLDRSKFISFETGIDFLNSDIPEFDFIRGDIDAYGTGSSTNHLTAYFQKFYFGVACEIRTKNNLFGLSSGLRFSRINNSLGEESYWYERGEHYYVLLSQEETTTHYLRVEEVNGSSNYLGIPVELRILPFQPRKFNLYFKLGLECSFLLNYSSNVIFIKESMNIYEEEIIDKFDSPDRVFLAGHAAIGFNISLRHKAYLNFELDLPTAILSEYSSGLVEPDIGAGFRLFVQVPF